ncbi:Transposase, mutator type [Quillaja saponaria]|uniref:Transposase, mutator type n=1 Tax=Quillaja saponaria TaxID=32244 RepID=A0AAD7Q899_QUISA|nr:Transposase, mutator type [Quillaja saponaria]
MQELKACNDKAWKWLSNIPPRLWSKAAFRSFPKNDVLVNNICEVFNSKFVKFRSKPIITMVDEIRVYIMGKMTESREKMSRYEGPICPKAQDRLEKAKLESRFWVPTWVGDPNCSMFEVCCKPEKYVVDLSEHTCSCRAWDSTGIPCKHAIAAIGYNNLAPESFVHQYFSKEIFERTYEPFIHPVNGQNLWPKTDNDPIEPPILSRPPGRPKKNRNKGEEEEPAINPYKLKRKYGVIKCHKCGGTGHNSRYCKGLPINSKGKRKCNLGSNRSGNKETSQTHESSTLYSQMSSSTQTPPVVLTTGSHKQKGKAKLNPMKKPEDTSTQSFYGGQLTTPTVEAQPFNNVQFKTHIPTNYQVKGSIVGIQPYYGFAFKGRALNNQQLHGSSFKSPTTSTQQPSQKQLP